MSYDRTYKRRYNFLYIEYLSHVQEGTRWFGKCWYFHDKLKYEFDVEFDIPVTYPDTAPEIALPELDGKTAKVRD